MKTLTVNELIARLQFAVEAMPECGDYKVQYHDWNEQYWEVEQGILNIHPETEVLELG